jgi:hypothetical protein
MTRAAHARLKCAVHLVQVTPAMMQLGGACTVAALLRPAFLQLAVDAHQAIEVDTHMSSEGRHAHVQDHVCMHMHDPIAHLNLSSISPQSR